MGSGALTTATVFVWMLNILMIFSQLAITDMTDNIGVPNDGVQFVNCSGTIITSYSTDGEDPCSPLSGPLSKNLTAELPTGAAPNSLFSIVDWITSTTSWIGRQINSFTQIVNGPYNMLRSIPMFQDERYAPFASIIGIMWWAISLLLIVAFIFGR